MTDLTVTGNLAVKGTSAMDGSLTVRADSFVTGFLRVGALAAVGYNVLEIAQVNQDLTVSGNTTLQGPLVVDDIIRTNTPHGIVCGGELHVAQDVIMQETLQVNGDCSFQGQVDIQGPVFINGVLSTDAAHGIVCGGDLQVAGNQKITGDFEIFGTGTVGNKLTVAGVAQLSGFCTSTRIVTGSLQVLTADLSNQIIVLGKTTTPPVSLGDGIPFGTTFIILVDYATSASPQEIVPQSGGSITIFTDYSTGATATTTTKVSTTAPGALWITQTDRNQWIAVSQIGKWTAA